MSKLTMSDIDGFIATAISRFGSESTPTISDFYFNLRSGQRISEKSVDDAIALCNVRGLEAERIDDGLVIRVNLNICRFNPSQNTAFHSTLNYVRAAHGYMN